jgi:hypothetical protein
MRVGRSLLWLLVPGALIAAPAMADEVVHFTNGTVMPISSHSVEKDMLSVELGGSSKMAFPLYMVDKIEAYGRSVFLNPTYHPTNQAVASVDSSGAPGPATPRPVTGEGSVPSRFRLPSTARASANPDGRSGGWDSVGVAGASANASAGLEREPPPVISVGDRTEMQLRAERLGLPYGQRPQGQQGSGRRPGLVRVGVRSTPLESGESSSSGSQGQQGTSPTPPTGN